MKRKSLYKLLAAAFLSGTILLSGCSAGTSKSSETTNETSPATEPTTSETSETVSETTAEPVQLKEGTTETVEIDSACIAKNKIGDSSKRSIYIYLPPTYNEGDKNYPVVYFLHGLGDSSSAFIKTIKGNLDKSFNEGSKEFIFVVLDGNIKSGGSFYVNSPTTGDWEDFVSEEVVGYMDSNYRTIADRESRCISGFSMGGYGAVNAALNRSDVFSSLLVFCPGVYADGNIKAMWDSWDGDNEVKLSYGQSFSPNNDSEKKFGNIPEFSGTEEDNAIVAQWDGGYGNWENKIKEFAENGTPLKGVQINYGSLDPYSWIPGGSEFFSQKLTENGIENELTKLSMGHVVPNDCIPTYFVPFCEENFKFED